MSEPAERPVVPPIKTPEELEEIRVRGQPGMHHLSFVVVLVHLTWL